MKQPAGGVAAEAGSDAAATEDTGGDSQVSAVASRPSEEDTAGEVTAGVSAAVTTSGAPGVPPESLTSPPQSQSSLALEPRKISIRRAKQATCELAGIGVEITEGRAGDWLEISTASSDSPAPFAIGASRTATTSGAPDGSQDGGSAVENHPPAPFPGPGPGGAGGASAAGGGPGSALSASFTLAGVLLQAEPRAMRRWRLSQPSWRTSFFVLIPERPD